MTRGAQVSGKRCGHENASVKYGETTHDSIGDIVYEVEYRECLDCQAWLPLGPSNDVGCEIEIRGAALARRYDLDNDWNGFESLGMVSPAAEHAPLIERDIAEGRKTERDLIDYYAGHLARCIAEHDSHHIVEHQRERGGK